MVEDLTGFIDGTENPQFPDDRAATTFLRENTRSIRRWFFLSLRSAIAMIWKSRKS